MQKFCINGEVKQIVADGKVFRLKPGAFQLALSVNNMYLDSAELMEWWGRKGRKN